MEAANLGRPFTVKDLYVNETTLRTPYRRRTAETKNSLHWGQRKLLLSEIEFFSLFWDPQRIPEPVCVYIGAAPGSHIKLLSTMFPAITFHLYDPAQFTVEPTDHIILHNEYFTDEIAQSYAGRSDVFFISDIRTADYMEIQREEYVKRGITRFDDDGKPIGPAEIIKEAYTAAQITNEDQIWGDMQMQQDWVLIMNPEHAFLKGRMPYVLDGKDRTVQYLKSLVFWQPWTPQSSTETRFKPLRNAAGVYELGSWSILEYEDWTFHHTAVDREQTTYLNPFTNTLTAVDYPELLNDYDSVAEATILKIYVEKFAGGTNVYDTVRMLSRLITTDLNGQAPRETPTVSLSMKRASELKSFGKAAGNAFDRGQKRGAQGKKVFRGKKSLRKLAPGKVAPTGTFKHTQVKISPDWREVEDMTPEGPTAPLPLPVYAAPLTTPLKAAPLPTAVKTSPLVAPVKAAPLPVAVKTPSIPAPVNVAPLPAPVKTPLQVAPLPAPVKVAPLPVQAPPFPAPVKVAPLPAPVNVAPLPASVKVAPLPAPVNVAPLPALGKAAPLPTPLPVQATPLPAPVKVVLPTPLPGKAAPLPTPLPAPINPVKLALPVPVNIPPVV